MGAVWRGFIYVANRLRAANEQDGPRRRTSWDRNFFSIGKLSEPGGNNESRAPGWKEAWTLQDKNDNDLGGVQENLGSLVEAVQSLRDGMFQNNLDTQSSLRAFEGRFERLEQQVAVVSTKVEAIGQELHELQASPLSPTPS